MKIVISDNDHVNLAQEKAVFQKAGMDFTLYQCHTCLLYTSRCV